MNSNHKIIQWNCRGLKSNYNEILLLLSLLSPSVFCLQETFLKADDQLNIRDFITYNYIYIQKARGRLVEAQSQFTLHVPSEKLNL